MSSGSRWRALLSRLRIRRACSPALSESTSVRMLWLRSRRMTSSRPYTNSAGRAVRALTWGEGQRGRRSPWQRRRQSTHAQVHVEHVGQGQDARPLGMVLRKPLGDAREELPGKVEGVGACLRAVDLHALLEIGRPLLLHLVLELLPRLLGRRGALAQGRLAALAAALGRESELDRYAHRHPPSEALHPRQGLTFSCASFSAISRPSLPTCACSLRTPMACCSSRSRALRAFLSATSSHRRAFSMATFRWPLTERRRARASAWVGLGEQAGRRAAATAQTHPVHRQQEVPGEREKVGLGWLGWVGLR